MSEAAVNCRMDNKGRKKLLKMKKREEKREGVGLYRFQHARCHLNCSRD
jgi:hypothetical protein